MSTKDIATISNTKSESEQAANAHQPQSHPHPSYPMYPTSDPSPFHHQLTTYRQPVPFLQIPHFTPVPTINLQPHDALHHEHAYLLSTLHHETTKATHLIQQINDSTTTLSTLLTTFSPKARRTAKRRLGWLKQRLSETKRQEDAILQRLAHLEYQVQERESCRVVKHEYRSFESQNWGTEPWGAGQEFVASPYTDDDFGHDWQQHLPPYTRTWSPNSPLSPCFATVPATTARRENRTPSSAHPTSHTQAPTITTILPSLPQPLIPAQTPPQNTISTATQTHSPTTRRPSSSSSSKSLLSSFLTSTLSTTKPTRPSINRRTVSMEDVIIEGIVTDPDSDVEDRKMSTSFAGSGYWRKRHSLPSLPGLPSIWRPTDEERGVDVDAYCNGQDKREGGGEVRETGRGERCGSLGPGLGWYVDIEIFSNRGDL